MSKKTKDIVEPVRWAWMHTPDTLRILSPTGKTQSYAMDGTASHGFIAAGIDAAIREHRRDIDKTAEALRAAIKHIPSGPPAAM